MKSKSILVLAVVVLFFGSSPSAFAATVSFQGLGDLSGGSFNSQAFGISADGSTVVGRSTSASSSASGTGSEAFRWTSASGMVALGDLPGGSDGGSGSFDSGAFGVSADGSVVVGQGKSALGPEAFRWTSGGGMVGLGDLPSDVFESEATGVSADGSTVVGWGRSGTSFEAFRWASASGMVGLGDLPGGPGSGFRSEALGVSADGSTVVGYGYSASGQEAFRWTDLNGNGLVDPDEKLDNHPEFGLGDLSGGIFQSEATSVSADGSTVVGWGRSSGASWGDCTEAFRWTQAEGMIGLGGLTGKSGDFISLAYDVSADGSTVVGFGISASEYHEAFIWDTTNGMRSLTDMLVNDHGLDLTGWTLSIAHGISDNGLTIAGYGVNPDGHQEAWITTIPEPATFLLFGLGSLALRRRRKT